MKVKKEWKEGEARRKGERERQEGRKGVIVKKGGRGKKEGSKLGS